jgi:hypothetical protein
VPDAFRGVPLTGAATPRALFAEHRLRAGVMLGGVYFERDRSILSEPVPDRITGGWLHPMVPRTSLLAHGPDAGRDELPTALAEALSAHLDAYLASAVDGSRTEAAALSEEARRALESLGYLE